MKNSKLKAEFTALPTEQVEELQRFYDQYNHVAQGANDNRSEASFYKKKAQEWRLNALFVFFIFLTNTSDFKGFKTEVSEEMAREVDDTLAPLISDYLEFINIETKETIAKTHLGPNSPQP